MAMAVDEAWNHVFPFSVNFPFCCPVSIEADESSVLDIYIAKEGTTVEYINHHSIPDHQVGFGPSHGGINDVSGCSFIHFELLYIKNNAVFLNIYTKTFVFLLKNQTKMQKSEGFSKIDNWEIFVA